MTDVLTDLKSLIEFASKNTDKIFRRQGVIYPMYHAIKTSGETVILTPQMDDKDIGVAMVKAWFALNDIDRYVFIDEAWILDDRRGQLGGIDIEKARREGLRNHPDRREVVMFSAENRRGQMQTAARFILRPEIGRPTLSPLKIDDMTDVESTGRMVGLLNLERPR
jgi:hypothetical protein